MRKALTGAAMAVAIFWAGGAGAAMTYFDLTPGQATRLWFTGYGPEFAWTDRLVDGPGNDFGGYSVTADYMAYPGNSSCAPEDTDPFCTDPFPVFASWDYQADAAEKGQSLFAPTYNPGDGYIEFSRTSGGTVRIGIDGDFRVDVQAVPEPAAWAMLIAGFGLVGGTLRRRRTAALAA